MSYKENETNTLNSTRDYTKRQVWKTLGVTTAILEILKKKIPKFNNNNNGGKSFKNGMIVYSNKEKDSAGSKYKLLGYAYNRNKSLDMFYEIKKIEYENGNVKMYYKIPLEKGVIFKVKGDLMIRLRRGVYQEKKDNKIIKRKIFYPSLKTTITLKIFGQAVDFEFKKYIPLYGKKTTKRLYNYVDKYMENTILTFKSGF